MASGHELGYDDVISQDSQFVLLEEGDGDFVIDHFERARHEGSDKIPPCNKVFVYFTVKDCKGNEATIREQYILWSTLEWTLSQLFTSVGLKKKGEDLRMDWDRLPGLRGTCRIVHEADRNDPNKIYNRIHTLYPSTGSGPKSWTPGRY